MKRIIFATAVLLLWSSAVVTWAQAPVIGPNDAIGFDYVDADRATYAVDRFEASYDGGSWMTLGIPPVASTAGGVSTYRVIPPQPTGTHTVGFRACNAVGCSTSSSPFAFEVLNVPGVAPGNVRKIPR